MNTPSTFDVIIIGGSYAGLSAGLALGRSLRQTLIIDAAQPCNRFSPHSQNFLTQDGSPPLEIAATAREQVLKYESVTWLQDYAVQSQQIAGGFKVKSQVGQTFHSKKLVIATGLKDLMPDIPGFAQCWGKSIIHCPYCHGYEVRNQQTGLLANGKKALHLSSLIKNLTSKLTIFTNGPQEFDHKELALLAKHQIPVIEAPITEVIHEHGNLQKLKLADGSSNALDSLYASIPFEQHSDIAAQLGCQHNEQGFIQVNEMQQTTVEGVYACGDNCYPLRSVANAVAAGNKAGAALNMEMAQNIFHR
ncbi:NAD(P)/FAD-dependent oxidoreductase [Marinoscillum furvescens]|uniref:Thioredoxin reductase n=1 Tax=Marinoscillum furvescens DSM 4134 TaxID=1122208 RepID=A0A3D9LGN4_MARFU|nr:NAD(P)/FAD-dependent oxidoreductase [Marinoscillum furvescens]REE05624.1 thioredoxin reductase [Marinoscillum furvescens DSM 4134]